MILQPGDADTQWGVFFIHFLIMFFYICFHCFLVMELDGENFLIYTVDIYLYD